MAKIFNTVAQSSPRHFERWEIALNKQGRASMPLALCPTAEVGGPLMVYCETSKARMFCRVTSNDGKEFWFKRAEPTPDELSFIEDADKHGLWTWANRLEGGPDLDQPAN